MSKNLDIRTDRGETPAPRRSGIHCSEARDLIPALALGAIETGERHALQLHCDFCPDCAEVLAASQRVVAFLPFAAPASVPSSQVKTSLFARIEQSASAPATLSQPLLDRELPIVDSPADKRRRSRSEAGASANQVTAPGFSWPLSQLSGRAGKFAAAPLAIALLVVGFYAIQTRGDDSGGGTLVDTALVSATLTATVASAASEPQDESDVARAVVDAFEGTNGRLMTQPVSYDLSPASTANFSFKAVNSGSPTESPRSIAPKPANCEMVTNEAGEYELDVSNVDLPGNSSVAGVYLESDNGDRAMITTVYLDADGNGHVTFDLDQPLSDYSALVIGPLRGGAITAMPMYGAVTFALGESGSPLGLSNGA